MGEGYTPPRVGAAREPGDAGRGAGRGAGFVLLVMSIMNKLDAKKETKSQTRAGGDRAREGLGLGQGQGGGRRGAAVIDTGGNGRGVKRS